MHLCSGIVNLCFTLFLVSGGESTVEYEVIPSSNLTKSSCNEYRMCGTLDQYAIISTQLFHRYTNYTLVLFRGVHVLTTELTISGIEELEVCADPLQGGTIATIVVDRGSLTIYNVSSLVLSNFQIVRTSERQYGQVEIWLSEIYEVIFDTINLEYINIIVKLNVPVIKLPVLTIFGAKISHSDLSFELKNTQLKMINSTIAFGRFYITSGFGSNYDHYNSSTKVLLVAGCSVFEQNSIKLRVSHAGNSSAILDISDTTYGNASAVLFLRLIITDMFSRTHLNIRHSYMSGLYAKFPKESFLEINATDSHFGFINNSELMMDSEVPQAWGVNICQLENSQFQMNIYNSVFKFCKGLFLKTVKQKKTVLTIYNSVFFLTDQALSIHSTGNVDALHVYLLNVTFAHGVGSNTFLLTAAWSAVQLVHCHFVSNKGYVGACINFQSQGSSSLYLNELNVYRNLDIGKNSALFLITSCNNVTIKNSLFARNTGTPVEIVLGQVFFSGLTTFEGNIARNGGGLSLVGSRVVFMDGSETVYQSNKAIDVGGAIYLSHDFVYHKLIWTSNSQISNIVECFFEVAGFDVSFTFHNNSAFNGGDELYGKVLYHGCITYGDSLTIKDSNYLRQLFKVQNSKNTSLSAISSDPLRVCLCDISGEPQCARLDFIYHNITAHPGERFVVPLVVVGEEFGTVTGTAYANLLDETSGSLGRGQNAQRTNVRHCTLAEYSIYSSQRTETITVTANIGTAFETKEDRADKIYREYDLIQDSIAIYRHVDEIQRRLLVAPVYFIVTLEECPLGFELIGDPLSCQCQRELLDNNIKHCIIMNHTGYVYRSGTTWLNATWSENKNNSLLIVHKHCPYGYCLSENTSVDLRHPNTQCILGHSGILCGGCQENLSLALGSNQCLECANSNHMTLLIFFSAAGFVLVFFIKALNLTVSKGTINGLVFYANIVWAEQSILFSRQSVAHSVINVFIAWLNLDLGIETCFARGLTAYQKVWLQFLFPVYVWCIVGVMILSSHYSTLATKLFGNNSVPVMATLFLLSYAKLLRTIITVFGFTVLESANSTVTVWLFDGNVPYLGLQHVFLFITAVLALLFLWLPYMFTLFVVPLLMTKTHYRPFRWIVKWKPFYDAYFGPYRAKHEYWIGVLLLVRVFLFILFSTTSASSPNVNLLAIIIMTTCLLVYVAFAGPVYKSKYLSLLENSFFLNLNALAAEVLYQNVVGGDRGLVVYVLVGIVVIEFVCITLYHCVITVKSCVAKRNSRARETNRSFVRPSVVKKRAFPLREELLDSL